ncbi:MAG: ACT domain-containing protein [Clostridia bacterium]|nr:ACT domain-containing protein [Clostridia bacterium]MBP3652632.1 ACT domain-containing protein [Clostridia bacterium]
MKGDYLIVHKKILPVYYEKVLEARNLLESGAERDVSAAVRAVGISRSTYYKYKDYIYSPDSGEMGRKAVISLLLSHEIGVLSTVLNKLSTMGVSVLTISQNLPIRDIASVLMTLDVSQMNTSLEETIETLNAITGVENLSLVAIE